MTNNLITRRIRYMLLISILLSAFSAMKASTLPASVDSLQTLLKTTQMPDNEPSSISIWQIFMWTASI